MNAGPQKDTLKNNIYEKAKARQLAREKRKSICAKDAKVEILKHFPIRQFESSFIGGYWPIGHEIDVRPLMKALSVDHKMSLPCTAEKGNPLIFRRWSWGDQLISGRYKTKEPASFQAEVIPTLILVPLLAFGPNGERLGYGGGYYDRTIASLRSTKNIFACGVAYAAQETHSIPMHQHDMYLDGVLTEDYFKAF